MYFLQALWVTPCHRRSTQMCLSPQTGVTTGGVHWGVLTTTAYWTLVGSLWQWRLIMKDKSRLSSTKKGFFCVILHCSAERSPSNFATYSHHQVFHRWRPVLEVLQLHRAAILLCRTGIRAWHPECQCVGFQAWGRRPAHVGGSHHWFPEPHYKGVWVIMF